MAAEYFSQNRIGALIVVERQAGLRTYIESGIPLDAKLSYDLLRFDLPSRISAARRRGDH